MRNLKAIKRKMIWFLIIVLVISVSGCAFLNQKSFGRVPRGERLVRVKDSPNYREGEFQNQSLTPQLTEGTKMIDMPIDLWFRKHERVKPAREIPTVKTDLKNLDRNKDVFVWFGHSSYFIQIDGRRILVDPVFCGHASPVSFMMKSFKGTDIYRAEDMPDIDYLFITHDHWDHLDYETITLLKDRVAKIICSLGVGEHLERWNFDITKIIEKDWGDEVVLDDGFVVHYLPARHFSGRSIKPKQSLWASYLLQTPTMKIYMGGDSGYDTHFAEIGKRFGEIDLAFLENGQYDHKWKYIHSEPEQVIQAAKDLMVKSFIPVHSCKFALATHPWDEPLQRITKANENEKLRMLTPMIGELVDIKNSTQIFKQWWVGID